MCEGVEEEVGVQGIHRNSFDSQVEAVQALVVEAVVALVVEEVVALVVAAAENLGEDMEVESPVAVVNGRCDGGGDGHSFRLRY